MMMHRYSVILQPQASAPAHQGLLNELAERAERKKDLEVLLVGDPTDCSKWEAEIEGRVPTRTLSLPTGKRITPGLIRNLAARAAEGRYLLYLHRHATLAKDAFQQIDQLRR